MDVCEAEAVAFLKALADPDPCALSQWLTCRVPHSGPSTQPGPDWAAWVLAQNLGSYVYQRLQHAGVPDGLREDERMTLQAAHYQAIAANTVQRQELGNLLGALERAGVDVVLLKGTALAYTVYDNPASRLKGDIDAWISPEQFPSALAALERLGYRGGDKTDRPRALVFLFGGEHQMVNSTPGTGLIELQWPAFRGEWVRQTTQIDHDEILRRCLPIMIEGYRARVMAPEDTLIHLCHHQAISHQFSFPRVRGLLDIHLVVERANPDWQEIIARARAWRLATVLWTVCGLARQLLDTPIPDSVLGALAPAPWRCRAIRRLRLEQMLIEMRDLAPSAGRPGGYRRRRFLIQLLLIDRGRDMGRLMWRGLFPEEAWVRARYGADTPYSLWRARFLHPWRLVTAGRA